MKFKGVIVCVCAANQELNNHDTILPPAALGQEVRILKCLYYFIFLIINK